MMRARAIAWLAAPPMLFSVLAPARADAPRNTPAAIDVDRDNAPAGRIGFGFEGGEPVDAWGASLAASWLDQPLRLAAGALGPGHPATQPVRRRETLALGLAIALGERIVLDARLRAAHQVGDRLVAADDPEPLARAVFQDLRIGGRIRVAGDDSRAAFLRAELTLPTGDRDQFAGDARWSAAWSLAGRAQLPHGFAIAGTAGIRLRGAEVIVGDRLVGDELFAAAGIAVPLPIDRLRSAAGPVRLTGELLGSYGDHVGTHTGPDPLEARFGALVQPAGSLTVGAHAGFGLDEQIGAPRFRAVVELAWTPRVPHAPAPEVTEPADDPGDDDDADEPTPGALPDATPVPSIPATSAVPPSQSPARMPAVPATPPSG
jgi:hypothetical protein